MAAGVLQVMSGLRSPSEVSGLLGVSLNRYYQLETRGLQALLRAMEPLPRGRRGGPEKEVERARHERDQARRETERYQALLRASQKALGFPALSERRGDSKKGGKKVRRPRVRAKALLEAIEPATTLTASAATSPTTS
jgi:hypothetical protein